MNFNIIDKSRENIQISKTSKLPTKIVNQQGEQFVILRNMHFLYTDSNELIK